MGMTRPDQLADETDSILTGRVLKAPRARPAGDQSIDQSLSPLIHKDPPRLRASRDGARLFDLDPHAWRDRAREHVTRLGGVPFRDPEEEWDERFGHNGTVEHGSDDDFEVRHSPIAGTSSFLLHLDHDRPNAAVAERHTHERSRVHSFHLVGRDQVVEEMVDPPRGDERED
jgi:hypothetical protein